MIELIDAIMLISMAGVLSFMIGFKAGKRTGYRRGFDFILRCLEDDYDLLSRVNRKIRKACGMD